MIHCTTESGGHRHCFAGVQSSLQCEKQLQCEEATTHTVRQSLPPALRSASRWQSVHWTEPSTTLLKSDSNSQVLWLLKSNEKRMPEFESQFSCHNRHDRGWFGWQNRMETVGLNSNHHQTITGPAWITSGSSESERCTAKLPSVFLFLWSLHIISSFLLPNLTLTGSKYPLAWKVLSLEGM
jgi:hypothetical protein